MNWQEILKKVSRQTYHHAPSVDRAKKIIMDSKYTSFSRRQAYYAMVFGEFRQMKPLEGGLNDYHVAIDELVDENKLFIDNEGLARKTPPTVGYDTDLTKVKETARMLTRMGKTPSKNLIMDELDLTEWKPEWDSLFKK